MGHRCHQQHDWSTVEDDGWKVDSGQTRSSSGPHSNPSQGRGPEHSAFKNSLFPRGVPQEVAVVRQTPSGQLTTMMLTSAHPCLHAVARAMCGSSFLALRCFPPAPFPSVSTCGGLHLWVVPERRSASGEIPPPADGARELRQQDAVVVL